MKVDWPTFAGGEIGDDLLSRTDTAKYRTALRRARNVTILPAGGVSRRPGFLLGGEVYDSTKKTRVLPFQFSVNQGYAIELGHFTMRFMSLGGYVLRKELLITGITNGNPATVSAVAHGYEVGWDVVFQNIEGMTEINTAGAARILSVTDDTFTIDLDTTGFGVFTGSGGGTAGDAEGGSGGDPPPDPPPAPTDPPPQPPPFEDTEPNPPIYTPGPFNHIYLP